MVAELIGYLTHEKVEEERVFQTLEALDKLTVTGENKDRLLEVLEAGSQSSVRMMKKINDDLSHLQTALASPNSRTFTFESLTIKVTVDVGKIEDKINSLIESPDAPKIAMWGRRTAYFPGMLSRVVKFAPISNNVRMRLNAALGALVDIEELNQESMTTVLETIELGLNDRNISVSGNSNYLLAQLIKRGHHLDLISSALQSENFKKGIANSTSGSSHIIDEFVASSGNQCEPLFTK